MDDFEYVLEILSIDNIRLLFEIKTALLTEGKYGLDDNEFKELIGKIDKRLDNCYQK